MTAGLDALALCPKTGALGMPWTESENEPLHGPLQMILMRLWRELNPRRKVPSSYREGLGLLACNSNDSLERETPLAGGPRIWSLSIKALSVGSFSIMYAQFSLKRLWCCQVKCYSLLWAELPQGVETHHRGKNWPRNRAACLENHGPIRTENITAMSQNRPRRDRISDEIPSLVGNLLSIHLKGISVWVCTFSWAMKKKSPLFRGQCLSRHSFIQPKMMVKSLWYVGCRPSRCHEKEKTHILCPLGIYVWVGMPDSKTSSNHKNG